ncbi:MAG: BON domain-containing protein [Legionella sp.]|nr:BON domain-containing protein [Legionella sp.]
MYKNRCFVLLIVLSFFLTGCLGSLWTGATLVYDRHHVYKKLNDYHLYLAVSKVLFNDVNLKKSGCNIDIAVFKGDVLILGHVPTLDFLNELNQKLSLLRGYKRLFNELKVRNGPSHLLQDTWITSKIRTQIFADSTIDPYAFKIVTADETVYLMGEVQAYQANKVIHIARNVKEVRKVVNVLLYYTFQPRNNFRN